ncbi:MAG TPA: glycosyltransferase family 9 protein [Gemmatimonadaceae bacterium]|nr:glycosyltransferase family 9 protein [Gemmatimonadaceae bacterium]
MAQTRTITAKKLAAIGVLDIASRAVHKVWNPPPPRPGPPRSFLVVEPWGIGDVVLSTSLMRALRANFPGASITLLAKSYAKDLLAGSGLVDDIIVFDFPWTAFTGKFKRSRYVPKQFQTLIRRLRARDFDVSFDARRDIRSNLITYFAGARRRIGYDFGGGAHLLTDVLPSGKQNDHKTADWLNLLAPLGVSSSTHYAPKLRVSEGERANARHRIRMLGLSTEHTLVGVHAGASHPVRRWGTERFAAVIERLQADTDAQVVVLEEKEENVAPISAANGWSNAFNAPRIQSTLRGFMALVTQCDVLLCSDSGPMHVANALDVPVTALFGPQRQEWYGPRGALDRVVQIDDVSCRPCFDSCIFATPHCMEAITPAAVFEALRGQLADVRSRRADVAGLQMTGQI